MMDSAKPSPAQVEAKKVVVPELQPRSGGQKLIARPQDVIRAVKVQISVLLGRAEVTVGSLFEMKDGDVVPLDRHINEPLELVVDGRVIARGELVVVDNSLGLRITETAAR